MRTALLLTPNTFQAGCRSWNFLGHLGTRYLDTYRYLDILISRSALYSRSHSGNWVRNRVRHPWERLVRSESVTPKLESVTFSLSTGQNQSQSRPQSKNRKRFLARGFVHLQFPVFLADELSLRLFVCLPLTSLATGVRLWHRGAFPLRAYNYS